MRYSMRARFQGTLLGAEFGSRWHWQDKFQPQRSLEPAANGANSTAQVEGLLEGAIALTQHLIASGTQQIPWHQWQLIADMGDRPTELALLSLPLALYCHDKQPRFQQCLYDAVQTWNLSVEQTGAAQILGQVLAIAFWENLDPSDLAPLVMRRLHPATSGLLPESQWLWLHTALEQRQSLAVAHANLPTLPTASTPLAIALFIFLTSPRDAVRSLDRAVWLTPSPTLASIVGALAGCYNGVAAFSAVEGDRFPVAPTTPHLSWQLLADQLLASWSGLYVPQQSPLPARVLQAIAPPKPLLRSTSSLKKL